MCSVFISEQTATFAIYHINFIVPKASWHWGSDSSVENDPLGEPGRTPLYVGLPSAWGSVVGDGMISPFSWKGSFFGGFDIYK